jgi:hypothetical protein
LAVLIALLKEAGYPEEETCRLTRRFREAADQDAMGDNADGSSEDSAETLRLVRDNLAVMAKDLLALRETVENLDRRVQELEQPDAE